MREWSISCMEICYESKGEVEFLSSILIRSKPGDHMSGRPEEFARPEAGEQQKVGDATASLSSRNGAPAPRGAAVVIIQLRVSAASRSATHVRKDNISDLPMRRAVRLLCCKMVAPRALFTAVKNYLKMIWKKAI